MSRWRINARIFDNLVKKKDESRAEAEKPGTVIILFEIRLVFSSCPGYG